MDLFPYANILLGILVLLLGFVFHWVGQLISVFSWDYATKIGIQEKNLLPEFKVYERAIAMADVSIGWVYGIIAIGLFINAPWVYPFVWIPGVVFLYHSIFYWFMIGNQNKLGNSTTTNNFRIGWFLFNFLTGILCILIAW
jgi:hypothetical protein